MKDDPSEVTNFVSHREGSPVVDRWMGNHPEFIGRARLYATPHIDVIGSEKFLDYLNQIKQFRHTEILGSKLAREGGRGI